MSEQTEHTESMIGSPEQARPSQEKQERRFPKNIVRNAMRGLSALTLAGAATSEVDASINLNDAQPPRPYDREAVVNVGLVESYDNRQFEAAGLTNPNLSGSAGTNVESVVNEQVNQQVEGETQPIPALAIEK